jgi:hypothetical protein
MTMRKTMMNTMRKTMIIGNYDEKYETSCIVPP